MNEDGEVMQEGYNGNILFQTQIQEGEYAEEDSGTTSSCMLTAERLKRGQS